MISQIYYYELHQGGLVWFCGFASELERWGAVDPAESLVA
jgi:hypothetical protein